MAATAARRPVDGRAAGDGIRGGLHAGPLRSATGRGARCADASDAVGGLPVPERLASRRSGRAQSARDGLDLRRRVHGRLECVAQHVGRRVRQAGRRPCRHELPRGALRLLRVPGVEQRTSRRDQGQLRLHGPDRRLAVGEAEHRRLRRRSEQRHDLWVFRRRRLRAQHAGFAAWRAACSTRRSSSPAARATACSPRGRCVRTASIRTIRCRPRRSGSPSRNRWGSRARTRPLWPSCAPSAPTRSLRGAPAQPGANAPSYETTPILDGKLITETAETAYKAGRQPRVPLMLGSNSADTAGNRVRARTKDELFARLRPVERRGEGGLRS